MLLTVTTNALLEVADLSEGWVLAACAEEVAEGILCDASVAATVKEGECFLVVCRGLWHDCQISVLFQFSVSFAMKSVC